MAKSPIRTIMTLNVTIRIPNKRESYGSAAFLGVSRFSSSAMPHNMISMSWSDKMMDKTLSQ